MIEWIWLLLGGPIVALIVRKLIRVPRRPKLLHTPYARPGPWHILKILFARLWLVWRLVRHPRVLNTYDTTSKQYNKTGIVPTELEKIWEAPHDLPNRESMDGVFFYGTDGGGTFLKMFINRLINRQAQVSLLFVLPNGTSYQLPNAPDTLISNIDGKKSFNAGGLKFQVIEPMRRWRVLFNGLVTRRTPDGQVAEVHLRINLMWAAFSRPFEPKREFSRKLLASGMARELWRGRKEWSKMSEPLHKGVDQWGVMYGTYQEDYLSTPKELYLRGLRQRRWGQSNPTTLHRKLDIIGVCEDGNYFYLSASSDSERLTHEVWGHVYHPNGFLYKINACNLDLEKLGENGPVPHHFSVRFGAKRRSYHAIIHLMPVQFEFATGRPWRHMTLVYPCHLTLNARQGRVFFMATNTFHGQCPIGDTEVSLPYLAAPNRPLTSAESEKLVLLFQEEGCRFEDLVGGKGASLALLFTAEKPEVPFKVPPGFCLTTNAWKRQIASIEEFQSNLKQLEKVAKGVVEGKMEDYCDKLVQLVQSAPVDPLISDCIREALQELFGEEFEGKRFAVRSSAVGEDSEDLSAAGQNVTVLGCRGFDSILAGLSKCWASLLSYQSMEYRRQHGEPLVPGMGVVIQEMVTSETAGVLFTVNPVDGDPSKMVITANYGLGESVVSGQAEPDTIHLKRTFCGQLSVLERTAGSKQLKIVLDETGTREEELKTESGELCISDESALNLGRLGIYLEKTFGGPRDIEFALFGPDIYLLQARPVTALDSWNEYELIHEFDTPVLTEEDYVTKANTGEVAPGAATPLTNSSTLRIMELNFQTTIKKQFGRLMEINPWYIGRFFASHQGQMFINVVDSFLRDNEEEISDANRAIDMAVFGHIVTTQAMHRLGVQRFGVAGIRVKYHRYRIVFRDFFFNYRRVNRAKAKFSEYNIAAENFTDAQTLYDEICLRLPDLMEIGRIHTQVSRASALTQLIAFTILLDGRKEWTPELYSEMAQLFSSISNVESADVPIALKELAREISESEEGKKDFVKNSADVATVWLQTDPGQAGRLFREFLRRHGHRSIREFDFRTEPWALAPRSLVAVLQSMVHNPASYASSDSPRANDDWLQQIKATKPSKYRALSFVVPRCRDAVTYREKTKSLLIRVVHCFRLAYRRLAQLLVWDGKIPDPDLIFFFTHGELRELIQGKGSTLITKAVRRRKLHPQMNDLVFQEMSLGVPKPIEDTKEESGINEGFQLRGTPVYRGTVRGTARVALNLEEAKQIQCGDILITRSTDIGWSPYFPLLAGVVTELGGLISHGAVVAREYGLPCIVGALKATQSFRSGETVVLDGTHGTITRVTESASSEDH